MDARFVLARHHRPLGVGLFAGGLLVTALGMTGAAADPFIAGQPAARHLPLEDGGRAALSRADRLVAALGLPKPASRSVERLDDRLESATYDEVTLRDERGRPTGIVRLRADGSLRHLVRLAPPGPTARPIPAAEVPARARAVATSAGLVPDDDPVVSTDPTAGWMAFWPRSLEGIPVPGDGTWVRLGPDGSVRSVARSESVLAPIPATTLSQTEARRIAERELDARMAKEVRSAIRVESARLAWVAPNDTFAPGRADAPASIRRLAWVIRAATSGPLGDRVRGLELDIDATTGALVGGDVLE